MIPKPLLIAEYNTFTHGVDIRNQIVQSIRQLGRNRKWWKTLFQQDFATCILNSFVVYKNISNSNQQFGDYCKQLCLQIISMTNRLELNQMMRPKIKQHFLKIGEKVNNRIQHRTCCECGKQASYRCSDCFYNNQERGLHPECHQKH